MRGSITKFQRKGRDGYRAYLDVPGSEKRKRITKNFDRKRDAERWLALKNAEIYGGEYLEPSDQPLKEFFTEWLDSYGKSNLRETSRVDYEQHAKNHIFPALGDIPLKNLNPITIQKFYNKKSESGQLKSDKGLSPATIRYHLHAPLRKCLQRAVQLGYLRTNPCDKVEVPNPNKKKKTLQYWDKAEVQKFLNTAKTDSLPSYYLLFYTAIFTGMRQGELLALQWDDIDFDRALITITRQISRDATGVNHYYKPKTESSQRQIAIDQELLTLLASHQEYLESQAKLLGSEWEKNKLVFPSGTGKILSPRNVLRTMKRLIKNAEIPEITFHDLRHTHASLMLQAGVNPKVIQERLGHSSIKITLDTYSHILPNMQADAINQFANSFHKKSKMQVAK